MIAGAGYSFDWSLVQPEVAKFTRVCTYDVSGTAWSDGTPTGSPPLSCQARVDEVHNVLNRAGVAGPYVLAGLSVGALVARLFTSEYKSDVAGVVLVDHAFLPSTVARNDSQGPDTAPVLIFKTPINLTVEETSNFANLPPRIQELHLWADSLKPALATADTAEDCLARLRAKDPAVYPLGDLPLAVVSTLNDLPDYKRLQTGLLALSRNSRQWIADRSFHSVEIDQPEVAVTAMRAIVDAIRRSQ